MSEWTFVWMAYGATWVVLAVYLTYVRRRLRRAELAVADSAAAESAGDSGRVR